MERKSTLSETSVGLINAVKAEAARRGITTPVLARLVGRNRKFFYDRFSFHKSFSTDDLDAIARVLNISTADIINSARLASEMSTQHLAA